MGLILCQFEFIMIDRDHTYLENSKLSNEKLNNPNHSGEAHHRENFESQLQNQSRDMFESRANLTPGLQTR